MSVSVRAATAGDAAALARVYRPHVETSYASFEEVPPDAGELERRLLMAPRLPWLVAAEDDQIIGVAYAAHHRVRPAYRWAADCSVYLSASATRRGVGRALYDVLLRELRELGYVQAFAAIATPNEASVRLHESCGFAHLGAWRDVAWYQLTLTQPPALPTEPRPWDPSNT
jgi:phosphinothricin acetyltransferase